jgi:hypothetical protein
MSNKKNLDFDVMIQTNEVYKNSKEGKSQAETATSSS